MPCRALCLVALRNGGADTADSNASTGGNVSPCFVTAVLMWLMAYEFVASTWRSLLQLRCMLSSVSEARELRYAQRIFEDPTHPLHKTKTASAVGSATVRKADAACESVNLAREREPRADGGSTIDAGSCGMATRRKDE
jgi:hypothetical protein